MSDEMTFQLRTSQTIGAIAAAMAKAQAVMAPAAKDSTNPHFKNRYASLASCFEAIKPMHENGIAVFQPPALHGVDGVCVQTLLVHSSGEWIVGELYMPAAKKDPQGFGSALTYARRYCLQSTTGLPTDDDDANEASKPARPTNGAAESKPAAVPAQSIDVDALVKALAEATDAKTMAAASAAVGQVKDKLTKEQLKRCTDTRDARVRELAQAEQAA